MYVHTFDTYSDRHVLGLLPRAGGIALCFAVLAVQRHITRTPENIHTAVLLFVAAYVPPEDVCASPKKDGK